MRPTFRDNLLVKTCLNLKSAKMTTSTENHFLAINKYKNGPKIGFLWLKLKCASLLFLKFFNFISKKVLPEPGFRCFCASWSLKSRFFHSKLKIFQWNNLRLALYWKITKIISYSSTVLETLQERSFCFHDRRGLRFESCGDFCVAIWMARSFRTGKFL